MFPCGICGKTSKPNEMASPVVTKRRIKNYECMVKDEKAKPGVRRLVPATRVGNEIVEQVQACPSCTSKVKVVPSRRGNSILVLEETGA